MRTEEISNKSKICTPPKKLKLPLKPKCLEDSVWESDDFDVSDSEDDIISEGGESSICDNEVAGCSRGISAYEFIFESADMVKQTFWKTWTTIFSAVEEQGLKGN